MSQASEPIRSGCAQDLINVTIPDSVTNIGDNAFNSCFRLINVMIPASVKRIGRCAFGNCEILTSVYFKGNAPSYGSYVFNHDKNATVYYLPGTTGWSTNYCGCPTKLASPEEVKDQDYAYTPSADLAPWHMAKITIKAVDDDGKPLVGMPVDANFFEGGTRCKGETDTNGLFVIEGGANYGDAQWRIQKDGYYASEVRYQFSDASERKLKPWNPVVTTIVRRVINPIPMYAKKVKTRIKKTPESLGYDLLVGDWVSPAGKGVVSDFIFQVDGFIKDQQNYQVNLSLSFLHNADGLVPFTYPHKPTDPDLPNGSKLLVPHQAPENGYSLSNTWHKSHTQNPDVYVHNPTMDDCHKPIVFRFRIRSSTNESGIITNAYYGKLGSVDFWPAGGFWPKGDPQEGYLTFTYGLNPTPNDRNLEFDPKRNLMKGLTPEEGRVSTP